MSALSSACILVLAIAGQDLPDPTFEKQLGWLIGTECKDALAPDYVLEEGTAGSMAFRIGAYGGQTGCAGGILGQAFSKSGDAAWHTTVRFQAKYTQKDREKAMFHLVSAAAPNRRLQAEIPPSDSFQQYSLSIDGCGQLTWVEFTIEEEQGWDKIPLIQSTLIIDDVICVCTETSYMSPWDEVDAMIIFGAQFQPPQVGKDWRYPDTLFRRGDVDGDGKMAISDPVALLEHLFRSKPEPPCLEAADVNDDGSVDLGDAIATLFYLFLKGLAPPSPGPKVCGPDPTPDALTCATPPGCRW